MADWVDKYHEIVEFERILTGRHPWIEPGPYIDDSMWKGIRRFEDAMAVIATATSRFVEGVRRG